MKLFVYATLKNKGTLGKALGEHAEKDMVKARLPGYRHQNVHYKDDSWPTVLKGGAGVDGQLVDLSDEELAKLDKYEDHYARKEVETDHGPAYVYVFQRPSVRASLAEVAKWRSEYE